MKPQRFPIKFDKWYGYLSTALFLPPSSSYVEITEEDVLVQMGWAFQCRFPRTAVSLTTVANESPLSRGVHGFAGRWLVNGSGQGIVNIHLTPAQRGYVMGFPVRMRHLMVSVAEPSALAAALTQQRGRRCEYCEKGAGST